METNENKRFLMRNIILIVIIAIISLWGVSYDASECPSEMVSYWTFDNETNPGTDEIGKNNGNVHEAVWTVGRRRRPSPRT